jgi:hypothetical protein
MLACLLALISLLWQATLNLSHFRRSFAGVLSLRPGTVNEDAPMAEREFEEKFAGNNITVPRAFVKYLELLED